MHCYKDVLCPDMRSGKFWKHLREVAPGSSDHVGVMVAVPAFSDLTNEFENPTELESESKQWQMRVALPCRQGLRKRSLTELLFCMLRSSHNL